jgi:hypothetical protein
MEPWTIGPPGYQLWDVTRRPGAEVTEVNFPPEQVEPYPTRYDALQNQILRKIRATEGSPRADNVEVDVLSNGSVRIQGRVTSQYIKDNIERMVASDFPIEEQRRNTRTARKIINEMVVEGP